MVAYKDYYQLLGVDRKATEKEIKSAYRKLARQYHPDVNPGAEAKFKEINEAYEVLGDPQKRQMYDNLGSNWQHGANFNAGGAEGQWQDMGFGGGSGVFSDFFDMIFGQMGAGQAGGNRNVHFSMGGDPFSAGGFQQQHTRSQPKAKPVDLDVTQPLSLDLDDIWGEATTQTVLIKDGRGSTKSLSVKIPKGIRPGKKIKLADQGLEQGGRRGHLYLEIKVRPHAVYQLEGDNLVVDVPLSASQLLLGAEVSVPTPQGAVTLKIPERTEPGKKLRIKGRGLPGGTSSTQGDLFAKLKLRMPSELTAEQRQVLESLQAAGL